MQKKWYIYEQEEVKGPFTSTEAESIYRSNSHPYRFWCKEQSQWLTGSEFLTAIQEERESLNSFWRKQKTQGLWKLRKKTDHNQKEFSSFSDMLEFLKSQNNLNDFSFFTQGFASWKEVFQIPQIMEEMGINRRLHQRVPIEGELWIVDQNAQGEVAPNQQALFLVSISEGGMGALGENNLNLKDKFHFKIKSPNFNTSLFGQAEVVFKGQGSVLGLKFTQISLEAKVLIIEYVKHFS